MGRKRQVLDTQLTQDEKQKLNKMIKDKTDEIYKKVQEQYPDDYNRTIMMDDETTKEKNEILRKIKFFK